MRRQHNLFSRFSLTAVVLALSFPILAEDGNYWMTEDRIRLSLGGYFPKFDSEFKVSNNQGNGTVVDLEDDLGLDDSATSIRIEGGYRFNAKHRFMVSYFNMSRNATEVLTRSLIIDDKLYPKGSTVKSDFSVQFFRLLYGYSFYQTNKIDITFSTGIVGLNADSTVESSFNATEKNNEFVPLPVFGFRGDYVLSSDWLLRAGIDYFEYDDDTVDAQVIDWNLAIEYIIWKRIGVGLSYGSFSVEGEDIESDDIVNVDIEGLFVYCKFSF
jgi:hypothetical protein